MPLAAATGVVRWGQEPLCFAAASSDRAALERMALVMRPWRLPAGGPAVCCSQVEPAADDGWEAR